MLQTKICAYGDHANNFLGYLAYDDTWDAPRPAVLVAHNWCGRDASFCDKAKALAALGYVGFALDFFGDAKLSEHNDERTQLIKPYLDERQKITEHTQMALDCITTQPFVNKKEIAAIGYCFGGLAVLDMARAQQDVQAVVSFHGLLTPPNNSPSRTINSKILVCHGYDDPMVPPKQLLAFSQEMQQSQADWQVHVYGNTQHAFTTLDANDSHLGTVYNASADKRSWHAARYFLQACFSDAHMESRQTA